MELYGLVYPDGTKELASVVLDEEGNPRVDTLAPYPTPEDWVAPALLPVVKLTKPAEGEWESEGSLV
jgi:hypothetical protein